MRFLERGAVARPSRAAQKEAYMAERTGRITTSDGVGLHYAIAGDGPPSVLVPNGFYLEEDLGPGLYGRTVVFFDARNRGRSDAVRDRERLVGGIANDVEDLETLRRHFGIERAFTLGHSYMGLVVALHALRYQAHVAGVVQLGPMGPVPRKAYPPDLSWSDAVSRGVFESLAALQKERAAYEPRAFCEEAWRALRPLYVTDPGNAHRIRWDRCDLPNELGALSYWNAYLFPSIQSVALDADATVDLQVPVLTIHGRKDRSAPYGGGRDWARLLPRGRLLTVDEGSHAPWVEAPERVLGALRALVEGGFPEDAERIYGE